MEISIRAFDRRDIEPMAAAFQALGWNKPASLYEGYLAEQSAGERLALLAFADGEFAGYVTIRWQSDYPPFQAEGIPEIQDFNVLPEFRRQGIGSRLMDGAEREIAEYSEVVGIGVGLYADYGSAQRLYVSRGYVPDGRGVSYRYRVVPPGESVPVDDDLVLWFTKRLNGRIALKDPVALLLTTPLHSAAESGKSSVPRRDGRRGRRQRPLSPGRAGRSSRRAFPRLR